MNSKVLDIAIRPKTDDAESFVVIIDGVRTRDVIDEDARNIRKAAETDERSLSYDEALGLGSRLLKSIESENNEIAERIGACVQKGLPLVLLFSITYEIESLPIELLSSDGRFLALDKYLTIARKVESSHIRPLPKSDKGRLSCVFMATSPEDLDPADVLQFEKEEDILAKISLSYPIDLIIDDSGGLQGLKNSVYKAKRMTPADDCDTLDVLHISGHARAEGLADPVFLMEDLYGQSVSVTARELWNAIKLNHPKVIFLSGCQTAMSGTVASHGSFAKQIVREGVPFAIAWGQSVFDDDAMQAAYEFYGALASGMSLHGAVQMARISLRERLHAWPILRLYVERGEDFTFVNAHKKMVDHIPNKVIYSHFEHGRVRYLQEGFVGRRREIQFALNQINRTPQSKILWIHGPKGLGKSCLACRIIERVEEDYRDRVLVFSGALNAEALFPRLMDHFDRLGDNDAIEILSSLISVAEKVKKLFREVFSKHSYLFLFDDFEVNMEIESEKNRLKEGSHQIIADFLRCLSWCDNRTFCIVTSTLGKDEESEWADLVSSITLSSFKPEELNKLLLNGNFEHVVRSGNSEVYLTLSKGNPRLLEIFEHVARREDRFSIEDLKARLIGKTNEFIVEQLSQLLTEDSAPHFQEYCQRISVLGLPLHSEAFQHFGPLGLLKDAVNRGIIESYRTGTGEPIYWVNVLLREALMKMMDTVQMVDAHEMALKMYETELFKSLHMTLPVLEELVRHASLSHDGVKVVQYGIEVAGFLRRKELYLESLNLLQNLESGVSDQVIDEARKRGVPYVATLCNNLGLSMKDSGYEHNSLSYFEKALAIAQTTSPAPEILISNILNNLGMYHDDNNDPRQALKYYEKSLQYLEPDHPELIVRMHNLGMAHTKLGEYQKAEDVFKQSAKKALTHSGRTSEEYIRALSGLASLRDAQGRLNYAANILSRVDELFQKSDHVSLRTMAEVYLFLGDVLDKLRRHEEALKNYEKAYGVYVRLFGVNSVMLFTPLNNIASSFLYLESHEKVDPVLERIENLLREHEVPSDDMRYAYYFHTCASASAKQNNPYKARVYLKKELQILEKQPSIPVYPAFVCCHHLAMVCASIRKKSEGKKYYEKALKYKEALPEELFQDSN